METKTDCIISEAQPIPDLFETQDINDYQDEQEQPVTSAPPIVPREFDDIKNEVRIQPRALIAFELDPEKCDFSYKRKK